MAKIEVDYKKLRQLASDIDDYCDLQEKKMNSCRQNIQNGLGSEWRGMDAKEFLDSWETVNDADSTAAKFHSNMIACRDMLKKSADIYEDAQIDIVNRACRLSR